MGPLHKEDLKQTTIKQANKQINNKQNDKQIANKNKFRNWGIFINFPPPDPTAIIKISKKG